MRFGLFWNFENIYQKFVNDDSKARKFQLRKYRFAVFLAEYFFIATKFELKKHRLAVFLADTFMARKFDFNLENIVLL